MDQSPLPVDLQQQFFNRCIELYQTTSAKGEKHFAFSIFEATVSVRCSATSRLSDLLTMTPICAGGETHHAHYRLLITDNSCEGFETPESPFDRFRFTHRGDVLGAEEGAYRSMYFHQWSTIGVLNKDEQSAVVLIRDLSDLSQEALWYMIVAVLSIMMEESGVLFLPARLNIKNHQCILQVEAKTGSDHIGFAAPVKRPPDPVSHWVAVIPRSVPLALSIPVQGMEKHSFRPLPVSSIRFHNQTHPASGNKDERYSIRHFSRLTFNTLSLLPYSGVHQQTMIEMLQKLVMAKQSVEIALPPRGDCFPSISFIIPAYNAAPFLHEAVESIASTGYPDPEVIIVDDGSTDETAQLISSLALKCRYLYQPNSGVSAARNRGLAASTGEVIVFLDADDLLNPPALYSLLKTLLSNPNAIAVAGFAQKFRAGDQGNNIFTGSPAESYPWYVGATLFRKTAFERNGLFDEELRCSEDTDWFIRAREKNLPIIRLPEISLFVRRHDTNTTRGLSLNELQTLTVLKKKISRKLYAFSSSRNMSTP